MNSVGTSTENFTDVTGPWLITSVISLGKNRMYSWSWMIFWFCKVLKQCYWLLSPPSICRWGSWTLEQKFNLSKSSRKSPFIPFTHYLHKINSSPRVIFPACAVPLSVFLKMPELLKGWGRLIFTILLYIHRRHLKSKICVIFI